MRSVAAQNEKAVFVFVFGAGLIACFVWYEAWSRADSARRLAHERATSSPQGAPRRLNQYSSTDPQPSHEEFV